MLKVRSATLSPSYVDEQRIRNLPGENSAKFDTILRYNLGKFVRLLHDAPVETHSLLDVGCRGGAGLLELRSLLGQGTRCVGVDIVPEFVEECKGKGLECEEADICVLPFADGEFDAVICHQVLEHAIDPYLALDELLRVAAKSLLIGVPVEYDAVEPCHITTATLDDDWFEMIDAEVEGEWRKLGAWRNMAGQGFHYVNVALARGVHA